MGKLKDEATAPKAPENNMDMQVHQLNDSEMGYLRLLNVALQYHTLGQKIMSGYLYYVCIQRLGYENGINLQFEIDFDKQDNLLTVKALPAGFDAQAGAAPEAPAPPAPAEPAAPPAS